MLWPGYVTSGRVADLGAVPPSVWLPVRTAQKTLFLQITASPGDSVPVIVGNSLRLGTRTPMTCPCIGSGLRVFRFLRVLDQYSLGRGLMMFSTGLVGHRDHRLSCRLADEAECTLLAVDL